MIVKRQMLSEQDFRTLVTGKVITIEMAPDIKLQLRLSDIGHQTMLSILNDAVADADRRKALTSSSDDFKR